MRHTIPLLRLGALIALAAAEEAAAQPRRIVVSLADRKLALLEGERVVKVYDVAVEKRSTPTPAGEFEVVTRVKDPAWYGPKQVVPPGKANPLGPRWLGLSVKGYGIHGTNAPRSIGKSASHGCIRMRNQDVEELFDLVAAGTVVELRAEPVEWLDRVLTITD